MTNQFDVFLCHNSEDEEEVKRIGLLLKQAGLKPWLDVWELRPGTSWQEILEEQIETIKTAAIFVGDSGVGPWQNREIQAFIREFVDMKCHVIPVILSGKTRPKLPVFLRNLAWVDFRKDNPDPMEQLVWGITGENSGEGNKNSLDPPNEDLQGKLKQANSQRTELKSVGENTSNLDKEIVELKRRIRNGIHLKSGDFLDDERYRLVKKIGTGGFAEVWKAWDAKCDRMVAIKVLHGQHAQDQTKRDRFFRGARKMAMLNHPGIVDVYEPDKEEDERFYFVMPYLEGGDLRQAVLKGNLKGQAIIPLILELGEALQYAHSQGIIHRDVKPGNVLLDQNGSPRLTDFDLVRAPDTTGGTRTGAMGTVIFAAPEALEDAKDVCAKADVYGLAMTTIFCMLRGKISFNIIRDPNQYLKALGCCEALKDVLLRGVSWDAGKRYASAREFCMALAGAETVQTKGKRVEPIASFPGTQLKKQKAKMHRPHLGDQTRWIRISPGTFTMGDDKHGNIKDKPAHQVTITQPYYMGRFPVTNAEYQLFVKNGGYANGLWWTKDGRKWKVREKVTGARSYNGSEGDEQPVVGISWYEAMAYCKWLTHACSPLDWWREENSPVALLPTEAEWEFAARGEEGRPFPWGSEKPDVTRANYSEGGPGKTTPEGNYPLGRTPNGLEDMSGNVWEWCRDVWRYDLYRDRKATVADPLNKDGDRAVRSLRGGSWIVGSGYLPSAFRDGGWAWGRSSGIGFRVCLYSVPVEHVFDL